MPFHIAGRRPAQAERSKVDCHSMEVKSNKVTVSAPCSPMARAELTIP